MKNAELTMLIQQDEKSGWYVGQIEEFPAAISQGKTIEELKSNLLDALKLILETQSEELLKSNENQEVRREKLVYA